MFIIVTVHIFKILKLKFNLYNWGLETLTSVFYSSEMSSQRKGRVKPPKSLNIGVFDVRGCSTNEVKKGEIGNRFLRRRFDVCALCETKLKGNGEVVGRVREGVALLLSGRLMRCVVEWKEERDSLGVYIGIWTR